MSIETSKIDVIIPLYKPGGELFSLLDSLLGQTVKVNRIILINTEEKYFTQLIYGSNFWKKYKEIVSVHHISQKEFNHGGTRRMAVRRSEAEIFVMMTQDALPANPYLLENLLKALEQENAAVAYARQLPTPDCGAIERYTRSFNYPDNSHVKTLADLEKTGIKTFFCSNVCAAYKRAVYDELGGFVKRTIFNEDMIFAAGAVKSGYGIAYAADAEVIHSHNYTNKQQLRRNFDLGVSQADNPQIFKDVPSEKEGKKMVKETAGWLWRNKQKRLLPHFFMQCACKYTGYLLGKHYRHLPRFLVMACTDSPYYWE
ncbi:MAG: glycosyltransferase [Lachnospiraceae bacterium]|nr:glycosyltransferase [Lachnospiraceae bacterium]